MNFSCTKRREPGGHRTRSSSVRRFACGVFSFGLCFLSFFLSVFCLYLFAFYSFPLLINGPRSKSVLLPVYIFITVPAFCSVRDWFSEVGYLFMMTHYMCNPAPQLSGVASTEGVSFQGCASLRIQAFDACISG